jgi:hypothetical protein
MSAALDDRGARAAELLLAHCAAMTAALEPEHRRRPVFERLRELLGADLTRFLLFGLTRSQAGGPARRVRRSGSSRP